MIPLIEKILLVRPGAKCSVWNTSDRSKYMGEHPPVELLGHLVDWKDSSACPTEEEILALGSDDDLGIMLDIAAEETRKQERDLKASDDVTVLAALYIERKTNPEAELRGFLDQLENGAR